MFALMSNPKSDHTSEVYSDEEIARRRDELAKQILNTPPRPLKAKSKIANPPKKSKAKKAAK
jgi:hypothetical protein